MMNNNNQMLNNNNNLMMNNPMMNNNNKIMANPMMNNNNQMYINNLQIQNQNMDNESLRIKKIIQPYEEKIKQLEEQIRQKDFEITCLKDKLDKALQNNQNDQMINMFSMIEQYNQMNQMNINMNQFYQKNNGMNQLNQMNNGMNQFNQMNNNMNQKVNEIKYLCIIFKIKKGECRIQVQCRSNEKIKNVIQKFSQKMCDDSNKFYYFYNGEKIINDELTIDEFGINDQDEITVVEKNDTNQINKILKGNKNSSNSNKMIIPRADKFISDNNLSSENKKIALKFIGPAGGSSQLVLDENITVEEALKKYCQGLGLRGTKMGYLSFIFNAETLSQNDKRSLGSVFVNGSVITVIDSINIIGA